MPLGSNMHLVNAPVKGAERWPHKCEILSEFSLLDQHPKLMHLSETEVMKGSTRDGHLLGSHVLLSPQSHPSSPVNTRLQRLAAGNVPRHLWRFGQGKLQLPGQCVRVGTPTGTDTVPGLAGTGSRRGHTCSPSGPSLPGSPGRPCKAKRQRHVGRSTNYWRCPSAPAHLLLHFCASNIPSCSLQLLRGQKPRTLP